MFYNATLNHDVKLPYVSGLTQKLSPVFCMLTKDFELQFNLSIIQ